MLDRLAIVQFVMAIGLLPLFALPNAGMPTSLLGVYAALAVGVGIAAFHRGLGFRPRAALLIAAWWIVGITSVLRQGFIGTAHVVLLVTVAITGLLFGSRATLISLGGAVATLIVGAVLHTLGVLPPPPPSVLDLHDGLTWTIVIVAYATFGAMMTFAQRSIVDKLERTLAESEQLVDDLDSEVTQRTAALESLQSAQAQVVQLQRTEAIGRVASGVAHDFNNILMVILSEASLVARWSNVSPTTREAMRSIIEATDRATKLTRQLLMLGRRDLGHARVIDVAEIVRTADWIRRLVPSTIELEITAAVPAPVRIDDTQLHQVLLNLVINARDAMPDGGQLRLAVTHERLGEAGVTTSHRKRLPAGDWIKIAVTDTGTGIPADVVERMFEPFFTTKPIGQGTGLGLATTLSVVETAGGGIVVNSNPGQGTRFEVFLPASAEPLVAAEPVPVLEVASCGKVLLVDDNELVRTSLQRVLEDAGHEVIPASDATEAIRVIDDHGDSFDHVITDGVMPGGGAPAVIRHLRSIKARAGIVVLTGYLDLDEARELASDGVVLLTKPCSSTELLAQLKVIGGGAQPLRR